MAAGRGLDWALGFGYTSGSERAHRAEEALLIIQPLTCIIDEAEGDLLRLRDSSIGNRAALVEAINRAIAVLRTKPLDSSSDELQARLTIRRIRRSINEFRDERREGLVRARNGLLRTVLLTWSIIFLLLAFGLFAGVQRSSLLIAGVDFLIAALVGMFNRLFLDAQTDTVVDDYGLASARLIHTPLFSGLAGLGGLFTIPMLAVLVNSAPPNIAEQARVVLPASADLFNWQTYPFGPVLAIIFGLSPTALLNRLQQEAEQYKSDLKRSTASRSD